MLLLSLLVLVPGCLAAAALSPDKMRELLSGVIGLGTQNHVPYVYQQLAKIYAHPDSMSAMGNTARPFLLNPATDGRSDCLLLSHAPQHKLDSVQGAELHLYLPNLVDGSPGDKTSILVRRQLPNGIREDHFVVTWSESWVQLNVSQSIEQINYWLRDGLCVSAVIDDVTTVPQAWRFSDNNTDDLAFVMMWSKEGLSVPQNMKSKRSHRRDRFRETAFAHSSFGRNPNRSAKFGDRCTLESFYIDFRDIGWEKWIIAPQGLELGACSGRCPRDDVSSNYNIIINNITRDPDLYSLYSLAGLRTERCCVPTALFRAVLMFVDEDKDIVIQSVENIVVGGCGCV